MRLSRRPAKHSPFLKRKCCQSTEEETLDCKGHLIGIHGCKPAQKEIRGRELRGTKDQTIQVCTAIHLKEILQDIKALRIEIPDITVHPKETENPDIIVRKRENLSTPWKDRDHMTEQAAPRTGITGTTEAWRGSSAHPREETGNTGAKHHLSATAITETEIEATTAPRGGIEVDTPRTETREDDPRHPTGSNPREIRDDI